MTITLAAFGRQRAAFDCLRAYFIADFKEESCRTAGPRTQVSGNSEETAARRGARDNDENCVYAIAPKQCLKFDCNSLKSRLDLISTVQVGPDWATGTGTHSVSPFW